MNRKCKYYLEDSNEFTWDEVELEAFKKVIIERKLNHCMDDIFLLGFLRARKYNRDKALKLLKNYYYARRKYTNFFTNLNPLTLENALNFNFVQFLPNPDQDGRFIAVARISHWHTSISAMDVARCFFLFFDFQLNYHRTQVNGIVVIINTKDTTWKHVVQFTPNFIVSLLDTLYDSYQIRYKEIHFVNMNRLFQAIMTIAYPLMPYKLRKRMHFHGSDMKSLHKFVNPKYLPADFDGQLSTFDTTKANQILKDNEEFFHINEKTWKQTL
ncbi:alpha-tocopherol transfer protein-like [Centruroides sculpturatus]|uniref:alpha-tocopherol transfer protein-like n=1 Tax=Centruroides sculpturatus TaxID=218467 RepID=UPI000C6D8546|nr:alpha-tocopherol transfer protein-like [Centruroides sculpturatus]